MSRAQREQRDYGGPPAGPAANCTTLSQMAKLVPIGRVGPMNGAVGGAQ